MPSINSPIRVDDYGTSSEFGLVKLTDELVSSGADSGIAASALSVYNLARAFEAGIPPSEMPPEYVTDITFLTYNSVDGTYPPNTIRVPHKIHAVTMWYNKIYTNTNSAQKEHTEYKQFSKRDLNGTVTNYLPAAYKTSFGKNMGASGFSALIPTAIFFNISSENEITIMPELQSGEVSTSFFIL